MSFEEEVVLQSDPLHKGKRIVVARKKLLKRHNFNVSHYVLVFVLKGIGKYIDNESGETFDLRPGNIFQRVPGRNHSIILDVEDAWQCFIRVPVEVYHTCNLIVDSPSLPLVMETADSDAIASCFRQFIAESGDLDYKCLLSRVIHLLTDIWGLCRQKSSVIKADAWVIQSINLLGTNLSEAMDMEELAQKLHMSYSTFRRKFKEQMNCSPGEYRRDIKMDHARQKLEYTDISIADLSFNLGYSDQFSFSKQFKSFYSLSPSDYRKKFLSDQK